MCLGVSAVRQLKYTENIVKLREALQRFLNLWSDKTIPYVAVGDMKVAVDVVYEYYLSPGEDEIKAIDKVSGQVSYFTPYELDLCVIFAIASDVRNILQKYIILICQNNEKLENMIENLNLASYEFLEEKCQFGT